MSLSANSNLANAMLQTKLDDLERRLALLEQYIQVGQNGGLTITAARGNILIEAKAGGVDVKANAGNATLISPWGASIQGGMGVGLLSLGGNVHVIATTQITMNKAPTIQPN